MADLTLSAFLLNNGISNFTEHEFIFCVRQHMRELVKEERRPTSFALEIDVDIPDDELCVWTGFVLGHDDWGIASVWPDKKRVTYQAFRA